MAGRATSAAPFDLAHGSDPREESRLDLLAVLLGVPSRDSHRFLFYGPDGAYYVGELTGAPFPTGISRVWRIAPGARHAACGTDPACSVVITGRTAIIDLQFGPDGRLYVAQLDDAGVGGFESGSGVGGSVHACSVTTGACEEIVSGIPMLTAIAFRGTELWGTIWSLIPEEAPPPFSADVVRLTP
jgi:hypothetical protein